MVAKNQIPDSLKKQINNYRKNLFRSETMLTLGAGFSALLISFFLLFVSDRIWDTPKIIRLLAFVAGMACLAFFWYRLGKNWLWRHRGIKQLASKIQTHHRELGDRLLGAIELAQRPHADENISEELKEAAIKKIASQASEIDFNKDVDRKKPYRALGAMLVMVSCSVTLFFLLPNATRNALLRWCNPIASITRFTFIVLEKQDDIKYVPKGEPSEIEFKLAPESKWKPKKLAYSLPGASGTAFFKNDRATVRLEGLNDKVQLKVKVGDTGETLTVDPVQRPSLIALSAKVQYPDYTGRGSQQGELKNGILSLLAGSKYALEGTVSRDLKSASMVSKNSQIKLKTSGAKFATPEEYAVKKFRSAFSWEDVLGFSPASPYDFNLKIVKDREPFTECPNMAHFSAILVDEALPIEIASDDDFGVKNITAEYSYQKKDSPRISKKVDLASGAENKQKLKADFLFSPSLLGLPEKNLITFQPYALDYLPGRRPVPSAPYKIYILSHEQHMKLVQERLERVMSDLEDMIRREENSLEKNKKISKMPDNDLKKKATTEKIREQNFREQAEKREARKMTDEALKLMKEALRNKKFPEKTIAEWTEFLDKMNKISQQEMKELVKNLQKASKNQEQQQQRKKNMQEAVKNQQKMLEKLKKMLKKMDDSLQNLTVENFVNRLKKEAKKEQDISSALKAMLKDIVGLPAQQIKAPFKEQYQEQIQKQRSIKTNARYIQDDLIAFFARTRMEKYQKVTDAMSKFQMADKLHDLQKGIDNNFTSRSIGQSAKMAEKFNEWAKMLAKADNKKSPKDQGKTQQIDPEFLLGLMRIIQGEQNLRQKTRYLDKNKPKTAQKYKKQSVLLSGDQGDLHVKLMFLQQMARSCPPAMKLLNRAGMVMDEVVDKLRKPQTNTKVIAAETEIIELLSGAFQQSSKQSGTSSAMMSMLMQMLMQQPGSGAGKNAGQSSMGGSTDADNLQFNDPEFKKNDPDRKGDKTQGTTHAEIPEEYKSAIEAYFKKRSKIKDK